MPHIHYGFVNPVFPYWIHNNSNYEYALGYDSNPYARPYTKTEGWFGLIAFIIFLILIIGLAIYLNRGKDNE